MGAHERFFDLNDSDSDSDDMDMLDPLPTLQPTVEHTPPGPTDKIADEPEEQPRAREVREATEEQSTVVGAKRRVGSSEWSAVRLVTAGHDHWPVTRRGVFTLVPVHCILRITMATILCGAGIGTMENQGMRNCLPIGRSTQHEVVGEHRT